MTLKLYLDSNVVIDAVVNRGADHEQAKLTIALGLVGEFDLWTSPAQWTDIFYILSEGGKKSRAEAALATMRELRKSIRLATIGESEIDLAMALDWPDFEDAVAYTAARTVKPLAIVTQNKRDFTRSDLPVFTCEELFEWISREHGVRYAEISL